jgi:transcriptional regulator with XRE-family HTH domain
MSEADLGVTDGVRERLRSLRKSRGLNQSQFAKLLGVSQSSVAKWESGDLTPSAPCFVQMSELAEAKDRQWWRDRAAAAAGFQHAQGNEIAPRSDAVPNREARMISLINPAKVGDLGSVSSTFVEAQLRLPASWFPMGGEIRAVRVHDHPISPAVSGEFIAIVDISRRDPDRLVDCVVATRAVDGIAPHFLRKNRDVYFLQPLQPDSGQVRVLRHDDGEDSIIGQILKWIGNAPGAELPAAVIPSNTQLARKLRRRA